ncbi:hypothetical protein RKD26_003792 [Streptomyces calvus]
MEGRPATERAGRTPPRGRTRRVRPSVVVAVLTTAALVAGCGGDGRGDLPARPSAGPSVTTCATPSGGLRADLDGNGSPDRVWPPSRTGADLVVAFTGEDGHVTTARPRDLVGERGEDAEDVLAVVADFDRDGWQDLFIAATDAFSGDDPLTPAVSELRLGPFSPRGRGQSDHHVTLTEPRALAVADYDHDRHPDLAAYGHEGDGVYATTARLGGPHGLDRQADERNRRYLEEADRTDRQTPESMPQADPATFNPSCSQVD